MSYFNIQLYSKEIYALKYEKNKYNYTIDYRNKIKHVIYYY